MWRFSLCNGTFSPAVPTFLGLYCALPRFALSAMLLVLVVTQSLKQLVTMYNATKMWQPNRYINIFARDGTYYFFMYVTHPVFIYFKDSYLEKFEPVHPSNTVYNVVVVMGSVSPNTLNFTIALNVLGTFSTALVCSAMPRFIIGVREMYDHDARGRMQRIDTVFGFSENVPNESMFPESGIAFADRSRTMLDEDANEQRAVPLELVGEGARSNLLI